MGHRAGTTGYVVQLGAFNSLVGGISESRHFTYRGRKLNVPMQLIGAFNFPVSCIAWCSVSIPLGLDSHIQVALDSRNGAIRAGLQWIWQSTASGA